MIQITPQMRILVAIEAQDFRRGIDGLARVCREVFQTDPFDGTLFVFRNRRGTALKCLVYDSQGFWLAHKRLSTGHFRWWPTARGTAARLEAHQLQRLIMGGDPAARDAAPVWRRVRTGEGASCVLRRRLLRSRSVEPTLTYRGRVITPSDLVTIRELLATPGISRRALSRRLCARWQWRQPNGMLCDAICRGLLLWLHRAGHIALPPPQWTTQKAWRPRTSAPPVLIDTTPITASLGALGRLSFQQVRRTPDEPLVNSLLAQCHYLGYQQPVGEHLKYLVVAGDRPVACFAWGSAPGALGLRDRFIGWDAPARQQRLRLLAMNTRFLILPWVHVPYLASHLLGRMAVRISADWERVYHHPIVWLETFIDPARFRGTCYRAANWIVLGRTSGRGHRAPTTRLTRPIKELLGYPLVPDFRRRLSEG